MDKAYHQKKYHVIRSLIGMAVGLIPCGLARYWSWWYGKSEDVGDNQWKRKKEKPILI